MAMPDSAPRSVTVGDGKCFLCGHKVQVKASKTGYLCYVCNADGGGCGAQHFSRGEKGNAAVAGTVSKWWKPDYRGHYIVAEDDPEPDEDIPPDEEPPAPPPPSPSPAPAPKSKPAPARKPGAAVRVTCRHCGTAGQRKGSPCDWCGKTV